MSRFFYLLATALIFLCHCSIGFSNTLSVEKNRLPTFTQLKQSGLTASWDGRLIFGAAYMGKGPNTNTDGETQIGTLFGWNVRIFRPEAIEYTGNNTSTSGDPTPLQSNINQAHIFSENTLFDWPSIITEPHNFNPEKDPQPALRVPGNRLHMAVYPDPNFANNPFVSNELGDVQVGGNYETYRIKVVAAYSERGKHFRKFDLQVIVNNPRTPDTSIHKVQLLSKPNELISLIKNGLFKKVEKRLFGYEPTISLDGRLLIFSGNPLQDGTEYTVYSYNANPDDPNSFWSAAHPVTAMYYTHGPGAAQETELPNGMLFSDAYPLAKKPMSLFTERDGTLGVTPLAKDEYMPGPYPWLSWDASELFYPTVANYKQTRRQGYSVIGARTNWVLEHIDGPVNWSRGNVTDVITNWEHLEKGKKLKASYSKLAKDVGHDKSSTAFESILTIPLALGASTWQPTPDSLTSMITQFSGRDTYSLLLSHSNRYIEVPLFRVPDTRFVISFPFNEAIQFNPQLGIENAIASNSILRRDVFRFSTTHTADISGNGLIGELRQGAQYPFEYNDAKQRWAETEHHENVEDRILLDHTEGVKGNSIYFRPGSHVSTTLTPQLSQSLATSLWLVI